MTSRSPFPVLVTASCRTRRRHFLPMSLAAVGLLWPGFGSECFAQEKAAELVTPVLKDGSVVLANGQVSFEFKAAVREGSRSVSTQPSVQRSGQWLSAAVDPAAERYVVVEYPPDLQRKLNVGHELFNRKQQGEWQRPGSKGSLSSIFDAGDQIVYRARGVRAEGKKVVLDFQEEKQGRLQAEWSLERESRIPAVTMKFVPAAAGHYSLGYRLFWKKGMSDVAELLLPSLFVRRGLPEKPVTMLDPYMSTPLTLVQTAGKSGWTLGVAGDPLEIPFQWPDGQKPRFGIMLRHADGDLQPSIAGPVPGTDAARVPANQEMSFTFRILVGSEDWYGAYRVYVDEVLKLADYRRNWEVSLSEAVYNMVDLIKDDRYSGWWDLGKGFYQIESRNTVSQPTPAVMLSLYRLTADEELYRKRTVPTIEYCLSRDNYHFAPVQLNEKAGGYLHDLSHAMRGPIKAFAPTTFGTMWELSNRRTKALGDLGCNAKSIGGAEEKRIALDIESGKDELIETGANKLSAQFNSACSYYGLTGDKAALAAAMKSADLYIESQIKRAPTKIHESFWHAKLPDWEGLLRLYELTGEKRYLDASVFGARQLMAGIWTQPAIPPGEVKVPVNTEEYRERHDALKLYRGDDRFRLGFRSTGELPRMPEAQQAPAWLVSNVGLGYEGEGSYNDPRAPLGRFIFQSVWAPSFLRLALYTGEPAFETYARNAVIGRFANYPGYYLHGRVNLQNNPRYPYQGPDFTYIYYHHIAAHLGWCIDYLVSDAVRQSGNRITFPALRQTGYVYFNYRVYGHAPGKIFDYPEAWLWFDRDLVKTDQAQFNYLTAHDDSRLFILLMNQDQEPRRGTVSAATRLLGVRELTGQTVKILDAAGKQIATVAAAKGKLAVVEVPARGMRVLVVEEVKPRVKTHQICHPQEPGSGVVTVNTDLGVSKDAKRKVMAYGAPVQALPGAWTAYVWLDATREEVRKALLRYSLDGGRTFLEQQKAQYPFEFSIPVESASQFEFEISGRDWDGNQFKTVGRQSMSPSK